MTMMMTMMIIARRRRRTRTRTRRRTKRTRRRRRRIFLFDNHDDKDDRYGSGGSKSLNFIVPLFLFFHTNKCKFVLK